MNVLKSYLPRRSTSVSSSLMRCANQWTSSPQRGVNNKFLQECIPMGSMRRHFSSSGSSEPIDPIIDVASFQNSLTKYAEDISSSLKSKGFYSTPDTDTYSILPKHIIERMRHQSISLRDNGRFEQSWSERIDAATGTVTRFDKEGVFACEPDGRDYHSAPDLIMYMSVLLQTLPELLNVTDPDENYGLSVSSFNAKLAVTSPGGSVYPIHIDNPQGLAVNDTRKLTCILYLNPDYCDDDGGELRIYHNHHKSTNENENTGMTKDDTEEPQPPQSSDKNYTDYKPNGGRMVLFWSDVIPHEVLATSPHASVDDASKDRYALTLWIPTANIETIHDPRSKFATLGNEVF